MINILVVKIFKQVLQSYSLWHLVTLLKLLPYFGHYMWLVVTNLVHF